MHVSPDPGSIGHRPKTELTGTPTVVVSFGSIQSSSFSATSPPAGVFSTDRIVQLTLAAPFSRGAPEASINLARTRNAGSPGASVTSFGETETEAIDGGD